MMADNCDGFLALYSVFYYVCVLQTLVRRNCESDFLSPQYCKTMISAELMKPGESCISYHRIIWKEYPHAHKARNLALFGSFLPVPLL